MSEKRKLGECKWFNSKKGFGFITPNDGSEEVFVHQTAIHASGFRSLAEKEPVEYDTTIDENGRVKALNVTGPNGAFVKGAPKLRPRFNRERNDRNDRPERVERVENGQNQGRPVDRQRRARPPRPMRQRDNSTNNNNNNNNSQQ